MHPDVKAFFTRVQSALSEKKDMRHLPEWIVENTANQKKANAPWSFRDHEFQIGILADDARHVVTRKCSQIGMSETSVRMVLAMLGVNPGHTAIYTLPSSRFASRFTKARIDPVIKGSVQLRSAVNSANDSSELKQIGTSFLYITGSYGQTSAISVPADILIRDEVDFSNQKALSTFMSRLGHAEDGGVIRDFSTPTVAGYGISKTFDTSSQAGYNVLCDGCHNWVWPRFLKDVVIPGFDAPVETLEKHDVTNPLVDIANAKLLCPECRTEITAETLADPSKRQWVHAFPSLEVKGYQVQPFDVPKYNPIAKTLKAIDDYDNKPDWVNFEMGQPFEDAETAILPDRAVGHDSVLFAPAGEAAATGCVAGLDIGKTSHIMIGKRVAQRLMHVIYCEQIRQDGDDALLIRVSQLMKFFGVIKIVVDAGPDFSTALGLIAKSSVNQAFACYYTRQAKKKLTNLEVNEVEQVISASKVGTFDHTAKEVNERRVSLAAMPDLETVKSHLKAMKRKSEQNSSGEMVTAWINVGEDHYAHALNYLMMADTMTSFAHKNTVIPCLPEVSAVRMQTA